MINFLSAIYLLAAAGLSLYGFLGLITLWLYWRHRQDAFPRPAVSPAELPSVTVQLPIYNERYVVERLITAASALDYPRDRLQIQVIDDSTDDTTRIAAGLVEQLRRQGVNIDLLHRTNRQGYKAGALAHALQHASGEFLAIFDADFQPPPEFLQLTVPHFVNEPSLGMVQARWGHLNDGDSSLTAAQAIALDKHFAMEQTVRHRANMYPKFNGSGGVWRQSCLRDAGGWQADTVCEDLCLSTRAVLKGWEFRFLNDVTAPAELPRSITAFKSQQARWAKGSIQCLFKYGRDILRDGRHTLLARLYALMSMSAYGANLLLTVMLLLQVVLLQLDYQFTFNMLVFSIAGIGQPLLFILAQQILYPDWRRRLRHFPAMLLVAVGAAPSNSRAILQAMVGKHHPFVRTPKGVVGSAGSQGSSAGYKLKFDWIIVVELALSAYAAAGMLQLLGRADKGPAFLLVTSAIGLGYVGTASLIESLRRN